MATKEKAINRQDAKKDEFSFLIFDQDWNAKATAAIARVAQVWKSAGLTFPVDEVMEGW